MKKIYLVIICVMLFGCSTNFTLIPVREKPDPKKLNWTGITVGDPINSPKKLGPRRVFEIGQEGWVLIQLDIEENGHTSNVRVIDYSPAEEFCAYAKRYLEEAVFSPVIVAGEPKKVNDHYFLVNFSAPKRNR